MPLLVKLLGALSVVILLAVIPAARGNAVQGTPGEINIRDFGALCNDVADDTAEIQTAINALPQFGGTLILPYGACLISNEINLRDKHFLTVRASRQAVLKTAPGSNFAGKAMLDMAGSRMFTLSGLAIESTLQTNAPAAGLVLGRTAYDGAYNSIEHLFVSGYFTVASVYNASSEVVSYRNVTFYSSIQGVPAYLDTSDDFPYQLTNGVVASNGRKHFQDCQLANIAAGSAPTAIVVLAGVNHENTFEQCYFWSGGTGPTTVFHLKDANPIPQPNGVTAGLVIRDSRYEQSGGGHVGSNFITNAKTVGLVGAKVDSISWTITSNSYFILSPSSISQSDFEVNSFPGVTKFMKLTAPASLRISRLTGQLGGTAPNYGGSIFVGQGASATENFLFSNNTYSPSGYPFYGPGTYRAGTAQYNLILDSTP